VNEDKAARFHRLQRSCSWLALAIQTLLLLLLVLGGAAPLRDFAIRTTGAPASGLSTVALFTVIVFLMLEGVGLPQRFYQTFVLERRYGLSTASLRGWVSDSLRGTAISLGLSLQCALLVYMSISRWPNAWWIVTASAVIVAVLVFARLAPVMFVPRVKPLAPGPLTSRLQSISERAGLPILGVYEWRLGNRTTKANAALVGTGRGRRILLSDTLLTQYSDDEIEVILAHELGHYAHRDIRNGLVLQAAVIVSACAAAGAVLHWGWRPLGLLRPSDVAGLPTLLIVAGGVIWASTPLLNAWSRRNEQRADRFALRLTDRPDAFISAMRRLAAQNLAEERPSATTLWFFHTHPPVDERIQAARAPK
jgi:STE24 endopeptidase